MTTAIPLPPLRRSLPRFSYVLLLILAISLWSRFGYLRLLGHPDINNFVVPWTTTINRTGLLSAYAESPSLNYPPLYPALAAVVASLWTSFGGSTTTPAASGLLALHKLIPLVSELALIAWITHLYWQKAKSGIDRWLVPLLLAIHPGLIATTAFWGQVDSMHTLAIFACLLTMQNRRWRWAWALLAVALLIKAQSIVLIPLIALLTFRRFGLRPLLMGSAILAMICGVVLLPFILESGIEPALRPYLGAVDKYPRITVNAYNLWHALHPENLVGHPPLVYRIIRDSDPLVSVFSAKTVGLFMLGIYTLLVLVSAWRQHRAEREFVWAAALYFAFFMLPTQIHERYLYPAVILALAGSIADRRLLWVSIGLVFTYAYNILCLTRNPFVYAGVDVLFWVGDLTFPVALMNCILLAITTGILIAPGRIRLPLRSLWLSLTGLVLILIVAMLLPMPAPGDIQPLDVVIDGNIKVESYAFGESENAWQVTLYWRAMTRNRSDYTITVRLMRNDQVLAEADSRPLVTNYPIRRWYAPDRVTTTYFLPKVGSEPDTLTLFMTDAATQERPAVTCGGIDQSDRQMRVDLNTGECKS